MVLAALELDDRHLVSATVLQNLRSHLAAGDVGRTDLDVGAGTYHQHLVKADAFAGRHVEFFEPQHFAFRNAMLLAATFNYRIHVKHSEFASWTLVSEPLDPQRVRRSAKGGNCTERAHLAQGPATQLNWS